MTPQRPDLSIPRPAPTPAAGLRAVRPGGDTVHMLATTPFEAGLLDWLEESANYGLLTTDDRFVIRGWNRWLVNYTGLLADEVLGRPLFEVFPDLPRRGLDRCFREALEGRPTVLAQGLHDHVLPVPCRGPDGATMFRKQAARIAPLRWDRRILGTVAVIEDVTDRVRLLQELRAAASRYRTLAEESPVAVFLLQDGRIVYANPAFRALLGYDLEELQALPDLVALVVPEDRDVVLRQRARRQGGQAAVHYQCRVRRKDGAVRHVEIYGQAISHQGRPAVTGTALDVTERHLAEARLRASEERYRQLFENDLTGDVVLDGQGRLLSANPAFARMLGLPADPAGRNLADLLANPGAWPALQAEVRDLGRVTFRELALRRPDGQTVPVWANLIGHHDATGTLVQIDGFLQDLSERKHLEEQLRQSQKMEAVGRLAGGVAHDFNNLLTVINGYAEVLLQTGGGAAGRELLLEIHKAGERAARLTQQLLAFSRKQVLAPVRLDLNGLITEMSRMLRRIIGEDVELITKLAPDAPAIFADPGQLEQVILNLAVNARDAMPNGGTLTIATRPVVLTNSTVPGLEGPQPGPYLVLAITDTGCGMDAETQGRIFEPFFTTKGPGQGTGLGLATVYGVVKQTGGHIEVESAVGDGTTFAIFFPAAPAEPAAAAPAPARPHPTGTETILVAEDDAAVRGLTASALRSLGYAVLLATDGADALRVAAAHAGPIHLLATDVVMPQLGGRELAATLTAQRPGLRVLFLSGYAAGGPGRPGGPLPGPLLDKPFTLARLAEQVRAALDGQ